MGARVEATATALARIATALEPTRTQAVIGAAQILSALGAIVAVAVAVVALRAERASRSSDALVKLVDYFDANAFFVRMWRLAQVSRTDGPASIGEVTLHSLTRHEKPVVATLATAAFATDWSQPRADMFAVYFFALRVHAWLTNRDGGSVSSKTRLLNDTFGHQLLGTFLNHWMLACRVRNAKVQDDYYPTHYGLFDPRYRNLVQRLADDLLQDGRLQPAVRHPMAEQWAALQDYVGSLRPLESAADLPPIDAAS